MVSASSSQLDSGTRARKGGKPDAVAAGEGSVAERLTVPTRGGPEAEGV